MSNHLSEDQLTRYAIGQGTLFERQHVEACGDCDLKLKYFANAVASFRSAVGDRVEAHSSAPMHESISVTPARVLAFALSVIAMVVTLTFMGHVRQQVETIEAESNHMDPDALMQAVNMHLAQTVPAPMEPIMPFISTNESLTESGGVR